MAYFANGTEGMVFDCNGCKYRHAACPIAFIQMEHNYSACNIPEARSILDALIKNDGTCSMQQFMERKNADAGTTDSLAAYLTEELATRTAKKTGTPPDICERSEMKDYIEGRIEEFYEG